MRHILKAAVLGVLLFAAGCAMFNEVEVDTPRTTSIGRELLDLKKAQEKGAISEEEYTNLRGRILEQELKDDEDDDD